MRERYHPDHGMIPADQWERLMAGPRRRSALPCPMVIRDDLGEHLLHPATGEHYDSKSAFRDATKASGCIEMGNDAAASARPEYREAGGVEQDIKRAIEELS